MTWNITDALSRSPFGPDPNWRFNDPAGSPIGEEPRAPSWSTTSGGGGKTQRRLLIKQAQAWNWLEFFTATQPLDPYTLNAVAFEISCEPFEKQLRLSTTAIESLFPGLAYYELAVLTLVYESTGMRYYPGQGTVKEEQKPRIESVPAGIVRYFGGAGAVEGGTLTWASSDGNPISTNHLYYGDHPHCEVGSREIAITFPFAPTGAEPFGEGAVNTDAFQFPVTLDVCPPGTLKYMGVAKEASVVIPAVGIYTGLVRYRKTFIFHYLNAAVGPPGTNRLRWNTYWRARDQLVLTMEDMNSNPYWQYTPLPFNAVNWWI